MNSNPYAVPAIVACAVMLIACITGLTWVSVRKDREPPYRPEHTHRAVRARARAEAAGREADQYAGELTGDTGDTCGTDEAGWWDQSPPPPAVEVITGPGTRIAQTSELTVNVLNRVLDGLRRYGTAPPVLDQTRPQPALIAWDGKTPAQVADELAAKYLAAPQ